ncbi:MAG: DNA polymerase IV [Candidatus Andersenbacteria bacterium]|nr:DNA polymerase IV [Candidatus Andersenbacteria bacterium]
MLVHKYPKAIVHIDGDAFFASVEQAMNPELKGKPVVTGKERGIIATASYEARALGIKRGVTLWEAKKMCPELVILPTDYETVSLFSKRMFDIMRLFTPTVEEYSIDEGFCDITGLRRVHHKPYEAIAADMQHAIHSKLGITVSVGVATTKVLAKAASDYHKPAGLFAITNQDKEHALKDIPIGDIWNIGPNTAALLKQHGMHTALQFAQRPQEYLEKVLSKPGMEVWHELNGESVWPVSTEAKSSYQSISKTKTFTPPSTNKEYVLAQLMKNVENACMKARRYEQAAKSIIIFLKKQDHSSKGTDAKLSRATAYPKELMGVVRNLFEALYKPNVAYRATGVILADLVAASPTQPTLFENPIKIKETKMLYGAVDTLREKFGKHAVYHAVSLPAQKTQHLTSRGDIPRRKTNLLKGETAHQRLPIPLLQVKVG